ncbi:MAG: methyltransferase domain-containing protein [Thermaerobacterales bacterium]
MTSPPAGRDHPLHKTADPSALSEHLIALPGRTLAIHAYASVDSLLDQVEHDDDIPFWAELWDASRALAAFIWRWEWAGASVLELGAGSGLAGIAAALRGAAVLQTDYAPPALALARWNAARNDASGIEFRLADWRAFPAVGEFDVILGADILYEQKIHPDLAAICRRHLRPGGRLLLADPGREAAERFIIGLEQNGWSWSLHQEPVHQIRADATQAGRRPVTRVRTIDIFTVWRVS